MRIYRCSLQVLAVSGQLKSDAIGQGVYLSNIDKIIELTATDLPEPVVPATNICGAFAKSVRTGLPEISLPIAILMRALGSRYAVFPIVQSNVPFHEHYLELQYQYMVYGITSTTRTEAIDIERAKSREILVTLDAFTPGAKSNSKRVTTGPG